MKYKLIIFDFDGTIADSMDIYIDLARKFFPTKKHLITTENIRNTGMRTLLKEFRISGFKLLFVLIFFRFYAASIIRKLKPQQNLKKVLIELSKTHKLGILSSNSTSNIKSFLIRNDLNCFEFVESSPLYFGKEKKIRILAEKHTLNLHEIAYIGDEQRDIEAANNAGVSAFAVSWGTESEALLKRVKPKKIFTTPHQLLSYFS